MPRSAQVSGATRARDARSAICTSVRITTSAGSPPTNFSSIAPTAPKWPATSTPASAARRVTRPLEAPAAMKASFTIPLLVLLGARDLHDARPFLHVLAQVFVEFLRRHRHGDGALLRPFALHFGRIHDARDLRVELVDHRARRSLRRHDAEPDRRLVS